MMVVIKILLVSLLLSLLGCASVAPDNEPGLAPVVANPWANAGWQHHEFPGKAVTEYRYVLQEGRPSMAASAVSSASMMRRHVHVAAEDLGAVKFSWKVPELITDADLSVADKADSPVRIVLAFEGDRSSFSAKNAMLSELSHVLTGEPMPYATLIYVWSNTCAPGTVIVNPRTDRIRKLVVESGNENLNLWLDYERDIRADFEQAFGEPPGALMGIGIMTDSDNTHTNTRAWYGQPELVARKP
jgi:hypothetical protein